MNNTDSFFDDQLKEMRGDSREAAGSAARELAQDVQRQIRRKFNNSSLAFQKGVKVHEYDGGAYVRLSPILSSHAIRSPQAPLNKGGVIKGNPNLWILLPDGKRLGFKRIGKGTNWKTLKRKYGSKLSIVNVAGGAVVLFRSRGGVVPVYKIQSSVTTKQRIDFYDRAVEIGNKYGFETSNNNRQINLEERL